jgi:hypothetical protein
MADDGANKEDKFDFTSEGETLGYISLEQARLVAMQAAREKPGNYGPQLSGTRLVFQLVEQEEGEDYYIVTLSFRPEGNFTGSPGQEQFFIEKEGAVADRQVLSLPTGGRRGRFPVIPAVVGAGVLAVVVVGIVFAVGGSGGGEGVQTAPPTVPPGLPAAAAQPTDTPLPSPSPRAEDTDKPSLVSNTTPVATPTAAGPTPTREAPRPEPTAPSRAAATPIPPAPTPTPVLRAQGATGQGRIVFTSTRDGNDEIYVMNADGSA